MNTSVQIQATSNTFAAAVQSQEVTTTNGMPAFKTTMNACVDLFFKIGAMRGKDPIPAFTAAYVENPDVALRIMQWVRDIRGGSGERELFRQILAHLEVTDSKSAQKLIMQIPEIGRWDDMLKLKNPVLKNFAFGLIKVALENGNGLCAKWMPRKGPVANELRAFLEFSPKRYRKTLVTLTNVVETPMCAKEWDTIDFSHVPSVAAGRYKKAFARNASFAYAKYAEALVAGETKVNAGAVYPYDVLKGSMSRYGRADLGTSERAVLLAQWAALENYVGDAKILPMVDVSGSMSTPAGRNATVSCMDVAVSLGLYLAEKNTGEYKDTFLTFTDVPELVHLKGDVLQKMDQMSNHVGYSTNLEAAFKKVLSVAVQGKVAPEHMPSYVLILSDMQFDQCMHSDVNAFKMINMQYEAAGYAVPKIVFWNLNAHDNAPTRFNQAGVALISGFSPSIMKTVLKAENFDPINIMLDTVMIDRYNLG